MALFDGTQSFTPALEGQRIAIAAGQGAAQSLTSGMAQSSHRKQVSLQQQEFDIRRKGYEEMMDWLKGGQKDDSMDFNWLDSSVGEGITIPG